MQNTIFLKKKEAFSFARKDCNERERVRERVSERERERE